MYPQFRRSFWRSLWVALRRSPHDAQARTNLLRLVASLLIFIAWLGFNFIFLRGYSLEFGRTGDIISGLLIFCFLALIFGPSIYSRFERRAQERDAPSVHVDLKRALFREGFLLATILERCTSEFAMEKELPPNIEIITRRVLLDHLNEMGLRENLEPRLLDLLLAPDGHWTEEQKARVSFCWEYFSVLEWTLGLSDLRDLTLNPKYSIADTHSLLNAREPEKLPVLASWDLRPARDSAWRFINRCYAELLVRGEAKGNSEDAMQWALNLRTGVQEAGYLGDYVVGAQTISEVETAKLFWMVRRAYRRAEFTTLLVEILCREQPIENLRKFLVRVIAGESTHPEQNHEEAQTT